MVLAVVLSIAGAGNLAYFSDTETSTDNTFIAGICGPTEIDIMPGFFPNYIDLGSQSVIPVAILTTSDFDASHVDAETVRFGPRGAWFFNWVLEDVDSDGDLDMLLHFQTQDTGITAGDTEAWLAGKTVDGWEISASDSVKTVPPVEGGQAKDNAVTMMRR